MMLWSSIGCLSVVAALAALTCLDASATNEYMSIATGTGHTCVVDMLCPNSVTKCWGQNDEGQLGQGDSQERGNIPGSMGSSLLPIDLGGNIQSRRQAKQIAAGNKHTCVLLTNSQIKCFGSNTAGALGLGNSASRGSAANQMGESLPVVNLGAGRTARAVTAGFFHTCALMDDYSVKCWGYNAYGQLGLGYTTNLLEPLATSIDLGTAKTVQKLTSGGSHNCVLLNDNTIKCWGDNDHGQLGLGDTTRRGFTSGDMGDSLPAVNLGVGRTATDVQAGSSHTCAVLDNGDVKCWGINTFGQLGQGDQDKRGDQSGEMGDSLLPVDLGSGRRGLALALGNDHTCVLLTDKNVKCFGHAAFGQLGYSNSDDIGLSPGRMGNNLANVPFGTGRKVEGISAGFRHTCVILDNNAMKCWGGNSVGQLGSGSTQNAGNFASQMGDFLGAVDTGTCTMGCQTCAASAEFCAVDAAANEASCGTCTACSGTQYATASCAPFSDTTCANCSSLTCASDEYRAGCGSSVLGGCRKCSTCTQDQFAAAPCSSDRNTQCRECSTCSNSQFMLVACSATQDTTCESCESLACEEGLVRVGCGQGSQGVCLTPAEAELERNGGVRGDAGSTITSSLGTIGIIVGAVVLALCLMAGVLVIIRTRAAKEREKVHPHHEHHKQDVEVGKPVDLDAEEERLRKQFGEDAGPELLGAFAEHKAEHERMRSGNNSPMRGNGSPFSKVSSTHSQSRHSKEHSQHSRTHSHHEQQFASVNSSHSHHSNDRHSVHNQSSPLASVTSAKRSNGNQGSPYASVASAHQFSSHSRHHSPDERQFKSHDPSSAALDNGWTGRSFKKSHSFRHGPGHKQPLSHSESFKTKPREAMMKHHSFKHAPGDSQTRSGHSHVDPRTLSKGGSFRKVASNHSQGHHSHHHNTEHVKHEAHSLAPPPQHQAHGQHGHDGSNHRTSSHDHHRTPSNGHHSSHQHSSNAHHSTSQHASVHSTSRHQSPPAHHHGGGGGGHHSPLSSRGPGLVEGGGSPLAGGRPEVRSLNKGSSFRKVPSSHRDHGAHHHSASQHASTHHSNAHQSASQHASTHSHHSHHNH